MKKNIVLGIFGILIIGTIIAVYKYISFTNHYVSSDAAFVKSDSLTFLSFKLPGKIEKIYVNEGDKIKKGEVLAKLDTKDLEIQRNEIIQNINSLNEKIKATIIQKEKLSQDIEDNINLIKAQMKKLEKLIQAKAYEIDAKKYQLEKLKRDYKSFSKLFKEKKISREKFDKVKTAYFSLKDEIKANEKELESMLEDKNALFIKLNLAHNNKKEIKKLAKLIDSMTSQKKALKEKLALINQHIKDSFIYAPFDGVVAKKFANNDEVVRSGKNILSVVNLKDIYVLVYLQEDKLKNIKKGNSAKIHIDALDKDFRGKVYQILPASAATFALIPRDFSSGEFTKLQQRFFVKIKFNHIPQNVKVGMSGEVIINKCKMEN